MDSTETSERLVQCTTGAVLDIDTPAPECEPSPPAILIQQALKSERERIATYLHDEVLQTFAVCSLKAQLCERLAQTEQHELLSKELVRLEDLLIGSIDKVRELLVTLAY